MSQAIRFPNQEVNEALRLSMKEAEALDRAVKRYKQQARLVRHQARGTRNTEEGRDEDETEEETSTRRLLAMAGRPKGWTKTAGAGKAVQAPAHTPTTSTQKHAPNPLGWWPDRKGRRHA